MAFLTYSDLIFYDIVSPYRINTCSNSASQTSRELNLNSRRDEIGAARRLCEVNAAASADGTRSHGDAKGWLNDRANVEKV